MDRTSWIPTWKRFERLPTLLASNKPGVDVDIVNVDIVGDSLSSIEFQRLNAIQ